MHTYAFYAEKLKAIIRDSYIKESLRRNGNYERTMAAISAYAKLSYEWNQFYTDDEIEETVCSLSDTLLGQKEDWNAEEDAVLFYDGFGLDTRGLAAIYAKALTRLGYRIVWVTTDKTAGRLPAIETILRQGRSEIVYINMAGPYSRHVDELGRQFEKYKPARAFFYTTPWDVSAEIVFCHYRNRVQRYQINLTDHAYWLGRNAFDFCIEFREYGAGISRGQRRIPEGKIVLLPYYPFIDGNVAFQGFPFDAKGKKIVFSGGSLYKTIGGGNKFYKMAASVLSAHSDTVFLYAGSGDDSELKKLASQFKGRVHHIRERKDLFALMEHVDVYLNTYPMVGGLMMQYAAMAGKPPVTLNDTGGRDSGGILIDEETAGIEFGSVDGAVNEISHLLRDEGYKKRRGEEIKERVITEEEFTRKLSDIMKGRAENCCAECPDTEGFRREYVARFHKKTIIDSVAQRKNKALMADFPGMFIAKAIDKLKSCSLKKGVDDASNKICFPAPRR